MNIKDRISNLQNNGFFKEMQTVTSENGELIIYVIVNFPQKWIIDSEIEEKFSVYVNNGEKKGEFWFFTEMENGFDAVFDAIEYNIERMRTAEERAELLKIKIGELNEIFSDETISIEALRTLEFTFSTPKKGRKSKIIIKQEVEQEEVAENNENNNVEE